MARATPQGSEYRLQINGVRNGVRTGIGASTLRDIRAEATFWIKFGGLDQITILKRLPSGAYAELETKYRRGYR